jgi:hypothetical protein
VNDEPQDGQYPEEDFEIIEIDLAPILTDEQRSWPIGESIYPEEDFAIEEPLPMLVMTLSGNDSNEKDRGFPALVAAVSNYEVSLGGEGLHLFDHPHLNGLNGNGSITLIPWKVDGARDRLEQVARWVVDVGGFATRANVA